MKNPSNTRNTLRQDTKQTEERGAIIIIVEQTNWLS